MLTTTVAATSQPITVADAKRQVRILDDLSTEDTAYLERLIDQATEEVEDKAGRAFMQRTYALRVTAANEIELPMPPLIAITAMVGIDEDGTETAIPARITTVGGTTTITETGYTIDATNPVAVVTIPNLPTDAVDVKITYTAGYASAASIPAALLNPIYLRLTQLYLFPAGVPEANEQAFKRVVDAYRLTWVF